MLNLPKTMPAVIARFPLAAALMALFTVVWIVSGPGYNQSIFRLKLGLVIAAYLCVSMVLAGESRRSISKLPHWQIFVSGVVCCLAVFSKDLLIALPMALGAAILTLGNAVRYKRSQHDMHVWDFTHKIWTAALLATVGSIIYFLGVHAIQVALKALFGININTLGDRLLIPVGLGLLAPLYWLSSIPMVDEGASDPEHQHEKQNINKQEHQTDFISRAIAFIGSWLLAPLTFIYAAILLAYGLQIIVRGELPNGEVAGLTFPFLIVGTFTWLLLATPYSNQQLISSVFRRCWFFISIPVAIVLAASVWVRYSQYGLTPQRAALFLCCIWSLILGLCYTLGKKQWRDIRLIPGLAALLLAIGAVTAGQLSYAHQLKRAKTNLDEAGLFDKDGNIKPQNEISITDLDSAIKAKGALRYVMRHDSNRAIDKLFRNQPDNNFEYDEKTKDLTALLFKRLKLDNVDDGDRKYNRTVSYNAENLSIPIDGYTKMHGPYWFNPQAPGDTNNNFVIAINESVDIRLSGSEVILEEDNKSLASVDLLELVKNQNIINYKIELSEPLVTILDGKDRSAALIPHNLTFTRSNDSIRFQAYVLTNGF